jgi:peptide/nickel transport system permease protein
MIRFILRRVVTALAVLLVSSFIMYGMVSMSIDPFADLRGLTVPQEQLELLYQQRIDLLRLDLPWYERYWDWLGNVLFHGDLGVAWRSGRGVPEVMGHAIVDTLQLVSAATVLAIVFGVAVGRRQRRRHRWRVDVGGRR